tara:strand:- start:54 stop:317 length:264 start_codon:yes stop_codon:yes gene_type:complete
MRSYSKMKLTLTALTVAAALTASGASAYDPDDLQKLKDINACYVCDLSGADLSGAKLLEADLTGAIINGAILCNTTMPDGSVIYSGC